MKDYGKRWTLILNDAEHSLLMEALSVYMALQLGQTPGAPSSAGGGSDLPMGLFQRLEHMDANDCFTQTKEGREEQLADSICQLTKVLVQRHLSVETGKAIQGMIDSASAELQRDHAWTLEQIDALWSRES